MLLVRGMAVRTNPARWALAQPFDGGSRLCHEIANRMPHVRGKKCRGRPTRLDVGLARTTQRPAVPVRNRYANCRLHIGCDSPPRYCAHIRIPTSDNADACHIDQTQMNVIGVASNGRR